MDGWWSIEYKLDGKLVNANMLDDSDLEHIGELIKDGYIQGEIVTERTNKKCPKCGEQLNKSDVKGYDYVCLECDENFYKGEVEG